LKTLDATAAQSWCLVKIDALPFAVAVAAVAEIVEAEALVRLPLCSSQVLGLCTYRRDLVPVIALGQGPTTAPGPAEGRPVVLILRGEHGLWGIKIDRGVAIVAEIPLVEHVPLPARPDGVVVIGSITRGDVSHSVIDAEATWRNVRDTIESRYKGDHGGDQCHGA
jgi:chemotaxis signal transduction protein